ncbi:MAG: metalloregulator ArsR/SmtB family transcription factor [Pseudomonadales bacterium]
MDEHVEELDRAFSALGDSTRRAILGRLTQGAAIVTELAEPFDMSLNAVSKHIGVLERAGLLKREVRGREHWCSLNPLPLEQITDWTEQYRVFWEQRVHVLEDRLRQEDGVEATRSPLTLRRPA